MEVTQSCGNWSRKSLESITEIGLEDDHTLATVGQGFLHTGITIFV